MRNPKSGTCWIRKIQEKRTLVTNTLKGKKPQERRTTNVVLGVNGQVAKHSQEGGNRTRGTRPSIEASAEDFEEDLKRPKRRDRERQTNKALQKIPKLYNGT